MPSLSAAFIVPLFLLIASTALAQPADSAEALEVEGYAIVNYHTFRWQTDPQRRAMMDIERVAIEATYRIDSRLSVEAEVEFEHGGSGTAMELDKFEEFGEYEQEVGQGGEVVIEKIAAVIAILPEFNLRAGHIYVPIGLTNSDYEPLDYFTVSRSESETSLIPATWHETGAEIFGTIGPVSYRALLVNGLDATGFSSGGWVGTGKQGRFEGVNAENLAVAARLDYSPATGLVIGGSGYFGNSADNRPKPDMTEPANVSIGELHATANIGELTVRGQMLYGHLQNAGEVSRLNRSLSNNLNVKRTPVGSAALGWFVEAGYDILPLLNVDSTSDALVVYARYDFYDTMYRVADGTFDNPRWERTVLSTGLNYRLGKHLVFKSQYLRRELAIEQNNLEESFSLGMGIEI